MSKVSSYVVAVDGALTVFLTIDALLFSTTEDIFCIDGINVTCWIAGVSLVVEFSEVIFSVLS